MQVDLFGREVLTPISGDTPPLFHVPVTVARPPLPKGSASDARIARKFDAKQTAEIEFEAKVTAALGERNPAFSAEDHSNFLRTLRESGLEIG